MSVVVGLVMIVKDEESVIERAIRSAIPFITTWVIVDTGSSDATKDIIHRVFQEENINGHLFEREWISFGANRTEALALCKGRMDWALMLDADDTICGAPLPQTFFHPTQVDGYIMHIRHGVVSHMRAQIFRLSDDLEWYYEGVVHEYPRCMNKQKPLMGVLPPETFMETRCEGTRSKDPEKYLKDAYLLTLELNGDEIKNRERTVFYLAQSFRDAKYPHEARKWYTEFIDICKSPNSQELYIAIVNLILLTSDDTLRRKLVWNAINISPTRLEAQYTYVNMCKHENRAITQELYAIASFTKNRTPDPLRHMLVVPAIYESLMDSDLAIIARATGH